MKVKELIELLQKMPQNLEVFAYCDHGQTPERACAPCVAYTDDLDYAEDGWTDDKYDADDNGWKKEFVLL